jgi:hypothetical protein
MNRRGRRELTGMDRIDRMKKRQKEECRGMNEREIASYSSFIPLHSDFLLYPVHPCLNPLLSSSQLAGDS